MIARQFSRTIPAIISALLFAGAAVAQQQPGGGGMQNPNIGRPQGAPATPEPGNATTGTEQDSMRRMADQDFVKSTMENNDAQVQLSQLAQQKSTSEDVKQFSEHMVQVHTQLNQQLEPAAKQLDVSQPKGPSKKEKQEIAKLQSLSGEDFETAYIQAMAKEQQQSLKTFKTESQATQGSSLQQAAAQDEPVLSQHYEVLKKLAQTHNVQLDEKATK